MPYETAYSTEGNFEDITALEANQYFFDGLLTDSSAFQCSDNCVYPLTCKSFKKKSHEWKKAPHFCPGKNHSKAIHTCGKESDNTSSNTDGEQDQGHSVKKVDDKIILNISLSSGFDELKIKKAPPGGTAGPSNTRTGRKFGGNLPTKKEGSQVNSLVRLLFYYYSDLYPNDQYLFTTLDEKKYCLNDLFFDLDLSTNLPNDVRVFFGTASIIEGKTYYVIRMKNFCTLENVKSKPSILIRKKYLAKKINLNKRFERLSKESEFQFFYFGKITINKNEYLNFAYKNESKLLANLYLKD